MVGMRSRKVERQTYSAHSGPHWSRCHPARVSSKSRRSAMLSIFMKCTGIAKLNRFTFFACNGKTFIGAPLGDCCCAGFTLGPGHFVYRWPLENGMMHFHSFLRREIG